jgi:hypothetical protein
MNDELGRMWKVLSNNLPEETKKSTKIFLGFTKKLRAD